MKQFETELNKLKIQVLEMWSLVYRQMERTRDACLLSDQDLVHEVVSVEKMVDSYELAIDRQCEELLALQTPVAVDLRLVLSSLKINTNLERIGDLAKGIARAVQHCEKCSFEHSLLKTSQVDVMFETSIKMMSIAQEAYDKSDSKRVREIYANDKLLDDINHRSIPVLAEAIMKKPALAEQALLVSEMIRKLERVGDQCCNIADEVTFYVEAKVLKHQKKKEEKI